MLWIGCGPPFPCLGWGWVRREGKCWLQLTLVVDFGRTAWGWGCFETKIERWGHIEREGAKEVREKWKYVYKGLIRAQEGYREEKEEHSGKQTCPWPQSAGVLAAHLRAVSKCCLFNKDKGLGSYWAQFCSVGLNLHYICWVPPCGRVLHRAKSALCIDFAFKVGDFFARCAFKMVKGHLKSSEIDFFIWLMEVTFFLKISKNSKETSIASKFWSSQWKMDEVKCLV